MDAADLRRWHARRPRQTEGTAPAPAYPPAPAAPPAYYYPNGYPAPPPPSPPPPAYAPQAVPVPPPGYAVVLTATGQYGFVPLMPPAPYPQPGATVPYAPGVTSAPPPSFVPMPGAPPNVVPFTPKTTQLVRPLSYADDPYDALLAQTPDLPDSYMAGRFHQALAPSERDVHGMVIVAGERRDPGHMEKHKGDPYGGRPPSATVSSKPLGR